MNLDVVIYMATFSNFTFQTVGEYKLCELGIVGSV